MKYLIIVGGGASECSLREFCISLVEMYSISEEELEQVCRLQVSEVFENEDLHVTRIA